jgi:hypothetical protein
VTHLLRGDWRRIILFAVAQLIIISGIVTAATIHWRERQASRALPPLREQAITLGPLYDHPWMASDEQLEATLRKLYPRLRGPEPKINYVDHAYRIWGPNAVFDDPEALSGVEMRDVLLNHERFAKVWPRTPSFLQQNKEDRWCIRTKEGAATASHTDHTLASISETGILRDYPVITSAGRTTFAELVETSLSEFSVDQMEYEWSILTYALFIPPTTTWITSEGQQVTFDVLAERLMREMLPNGVCFGHHRVAALVTMLRIDSEVTSILSPFTRQRIVKYLTVISQQLVKTQHPYGYWDEGWIGTKPQVKEGEEAIAGDELKNRIIATGHILEWLAWAPEEVHPPRETLTRAAQWVVRAIEQQEISEIKESFAFPTHAANALALWRKTTPTEFMKSRLDRSKVKTPAVDRHPADLSNSPAPKEIKSDT